MQAKRITKWDNSPFSHDWSTELEPWNWKLETVPCLVKVFRRVDHTRPISSRTVQKHKRVDVNG